MTKRRADFFFISLFLGASFSFPALAQGLSGPAMLDVKEIVIQYPILINTKDADLCGFSREETMKTLVDSFNLDSIPAIPVSKAKPATPNMARIDLVPEIVTLNNQTGDCTSWISLVAQTHNSLVISPIATARNITVTYWRSGLLAASSQSSHREVYAEKLRKLAMAFAKQYQLDQPPALPDLSKTDTKK